jgi:hypothetical protein
MTDSDIATSSYSRNSRLAVTGLVIAAVAVVGVPICYVITLGQMSNPDDEDFLSIVDLLLPVGWAVVPIVAAVLNVVALALRTRPLWIPIVGLCLAALSLFLVVAELGLFFVGAG